MHATILDPCCGSRMMWFDHRNPKVIFGDIRREIMTVTDRSHGKRDGTRTLMIEPDVLLDFRNLPYPDGQFRLVVFDPPHLVRAGPKSWLAAKYGKLGKNWQDDLRQGFSECLRVLEPNGVLIFKWSEVQVKLRDVLPLCPIKPLFGHISGRKGLTHWLVFMRPADPICRRCGGQMKPGIALEQTYTGRPDFPGGEAVTMSAGGPGRLIDCMKCEKCGWSVR